MDDIHPKQRNACLRSINEDENSKDPKDAIRSDSAQNEFNIENQVDNVEQETQGTAIDGDLDPRIQIELEKLNSSTDVINKLELDLEEARSTFRHLLGESGRQLNQLYKEQGTSVEKARCYYDARMKARAALSEAQRAAARFEKASSAHDAAKEMVTLAEEGFMERGVVHFDQAWQEMLNHATKRVNEFDFKRNLLLDAHRVKFELYEECKLEYLYLEKRMKRSIKKSRPYFEAKARLNQSLDDQKRQIQLIEETIQMTKMGYADSLKELEKISEEIHDRRRKESSKALNEKLNHETNTTLGTRQDGVGAEFPSPCPADKKSKQISENRRDSKSNKSDLVNPEIVKNQLKCDSSANCHIDESLTLNSDSETNDADSLGKKAGCDDIDSLPLIGNLKISKNYKYAKNKKHRRKKNDKQQPECLPDVPQGSKLKKKAINHSIKIKESIEKSDSGSTEKETHHSTASGKRTSISSSSTTESAGNDATSARDSIISNCSQTSSRETASSSSSVSSSSESPSPAQSPKLFYERLTSTESADKKFPTLSKGSSSGLSEPCYKSNLGRPIHPFENQVGYDMTDSGAIVKSANTNTHNSPISSPVKKHLYSPTKLTNKYLSIKQEESEMSDAESLASLDPLDDSQIDQLMKDESLRRAADDIYRCTEEHAASMEAGDIKTHL